MDEHNQMSLQTSPSLPDRESMTESFLNHDSNSFQLQPLLDPVNPRLSSTSTSYDDQERVPDVTSCTSSSDTTSKDDASIQLKSASIVESPPISTVRYRVWSCWVWELLAVIAAFALAVGILVLLLTFNNQTLPDWGSSINLSTVAALMSTLMRACVLLVIAQIISHAKWIWIAGNKARPLYDLQIFDDASRGTLGAVRLGLHQEWRHPMTLTAALLVILSLSIGPFVQQAIKTIPCDRPVPNELAQLSYARYVPQQLLIRTKSGYDMSNVDETDYALAIYTSMNAPQTAQVQLAPSCRTGIARSRETTQWTRNWSELHSPMRHTHQ